VVAAVALVALAVSDDFLLKGRHKEGEVVVTAAAVTAVVAAFLPQQLCQMDGAVEVAVAAVEEEEAFA
jgi:hypothetical protein